MLKTIPPNTIQIKYLTKDLIYQIAQTARQENREHTVSNTQIAELSGAVRFPIQEHHENGEHVRVTLVINADGDVISSDLSHAEWDALPHRNITNPNI